MAGKGSRDSRTPNFKARWNSPLWDNIGPNKKTVHERFVKWLDKSSIKFFTDQYKENGEIVSVKEEAEDINTKPFYKYYDLGKEMKVRNWMREQPEYKDKLKTDWDYFDENWIEFVIEALELDKCPTSQKDKN